MEKKQPKRSVALEYNPETDSVPRIIATGVGVTAENIIKTAEENHIPIHVDEKLVKELIQFKVGTEIPPELYEIVAQVLVFIEGIDEKLKGTKGF